MKRIITICAVLLYTACIFAQAPDKLSYQAVVRNGSGELVKSSNIGLRIQILQGSEFGSAVFVETHTAGTNVNGLLSVELGTGTLVSGNFATINWANGPYFLKTETDPTGGTNYSITGTSQLLSVPYALYAKKADNAFSGSYLDLTDKPILFDGNYNNLTNIPTNIVRHSLTPIAGDILFYDGTNWNTLPKGIDGQVLTLVNGLPKWKDISAGNDLIPLHDPILVIIFNDDPGNHNMHIATDGNSYYTCNGGNVSVGKINKYTLAGDFVASYPIALDMRSIMYNKVDGYFYASGFESDWSERNIYKITNIQTGAFVKLYTNLYDYNQASVALSDDGLYLFAFYAGTLKKYKLSDGSLVKTLTGLSCGSGNFGGDGAVAVDPEYIYTWNGSTGIVYIYDHNGTYVRSMTLTNGSCGMSLSFLNGYLFVSIDGNYSIGTWYGYNIRRNITKSAIISDNVPILKSNRIVDANDTSTK